MVTAPQPAVVQVVVAISLMNMRLPREISSVLLGGSAVSRPFTVVAGVGLGDEDAPAGA